QTSGRVTYRAAENGNPDRLQLDLTGIGGGRPVKIDAVLTHLAPAEPKGVATGESVAADVPTESADIHAAGYRGVRYVRGGLGARSHPLGYVEITGSD